MRPAIPMVLALAALAMTCTSHAAAADKGRPVYVYQKGRTWCALSDIAAFKREAQKASANQQDVDEGTVWFAGDRVTAVEEYRTDADAEWSTLIKYHVDLAGGITSVEGTFRSDDSGSRKVTFAVINGSYKLTHGSSEASTYKFRRASVLSSFPFARLAGSFARSTVKKSCG